MNFGCHLLAWLQIEFLIGLWMPKSIFQLLLILILQLWIIYFNLYLHSEPIESELSGYDVY